MGRSNHTGPACSKFLPILHKAHHIDEQNYTDPLDDRLWKIEAILKPMAEEAARILAATPRDVDGDSSWAIAVESELSNGAIFELQILRFKVLAIMSCSVAAKLPSNG